MALAGFPLRREALGVCGRERVSHLHEAPEGASAQRREGLRQGPEKPGKEHHAHRFYHPRRSHGRVDGHRGSHRCPRAFEAYVEHFLVPRPSKRGR